MTLVAASLWSVPEPDRPATADRLAAAGLRRWHWDVSDGDFAAPGGFTPQQAADLMDRTGVPGEAHLMVTDPLPVIADWAAICTRVFVHVEAAHWAEALDRIRADGRALGGLAISPDTPLDRLPPEVPVLVMSIQPGQAGATFRPGTLARLQALADRDDLGVDGGVDLPRARDCATHGATWLVSGTALCAAHDLTPWLPAL